MRIYLAARYSRNEEMRKYRDDLAKLGHEVTSRWIDQHGGLELTSCSPERLENRPADCARFAEVDILDLEMAGLLIVFTEIGPSDSKGGKHVEFGIALALDKKIAIVGPRENVFYCLPRISKFDTFDELVDSGLLDE